MSVQTPEEAQDFIKLSSPDPIGFVFLANFNNHYALRVTAGCQCVSLNS